MQTTIEQNPLCSIIIPTYNGRELLKRFLPSIRTLNYDRYEVIIVDNASIDQTASFVRENYADFKIVESKKNEGTAQGSNLGLPLANGEYILWLSNDMELDHLFLRKLVETAESSKEIGICTCKMRRITAKGEKLNVIDSIGGDLDALGFPSARGINEFDRGQLDKATEVFFSFGGAMLIKREVLERIGAYDQRFFTLADDIDLCWRAHLAGYKVVAEPTAVLYHRVSATLGTIFGRSQKRFMSERNTLRMLLKNYSISTLVRVIPFYFGLLGSEITLFLLMRKSNLIAVNLKVVLWNLRNFRDTWRQHIRIQELRIVNDDQIRKIMWPTSFKIRIFKEFLLRRGSPSWRAYFGELTANEKAMKIE